MENLETDNSFQGDINALSEEILVMAQADQEMRRRWEKTGEWDMLIDAKNTKRLKEIIADIGWPVISKVGGEVASAAWLIVQHADREPEFQQQCLALMKKLSEGEVSKKDLAYLEDRVRVKNNLPTLYGTQFFENAEGIFGPHQIEDIENLNKRRNEMGLEPFEDYEEEIRQHVKTVVGD